MVTRVSRYLQYCEECGREIPPGERFTVYKYDLALDADDEYGDYFEVIVCSECDPLSAAEGET